MTTQEYEEAVSHFLEREKIKIISVSASGENDGFSWHSCECCKSGLGGSRTQMSAIVVGSEDILTYDVCDDCVYYLTYGELPGT